MAEKAVSNTVQCGFESHPGHCMDPVGRRDDTRRMYPERVRLHAIRLVSGGRSLNSVSLETGVSRASLREWRERGTRPIRRSAPCWVCDGDPPVSSAAYASLLGYYLGDGCISRAGSVYSFRVSCDASYPGIITDVTLVIQGVRHDATVSLVPAPGVLVVQSYWKHWPCLFPQHGPGRKHERTLVLADWQSEIIEAHPADFLRGLFHSDGCRVNNWTRRSVAGEMKRYDYPRWQFVNHSEQIRLWCTQALDLVDVPWRKSNWKTISVSTRAGVARLDELVGLKA